MSNDAESGELPIHHSPFDLRAIGRRIIYPFSHASKKAFLLPISMMHVLPVKVMAMDIWYYHASVNILS